MNTYVTAMVLVYCVEDPRLEGTLQAKGWALPHCSPSSEWVPGGDTGEIKAARKEPATLPHIAEGPETSNRHTSMKGLYVGLTFAST